MEYKQNTNTNTGIGMTVRPHHTNCDTQCPLRMWASHRLLCPLCVASVWSVFVFVFVFVFAIVIVFGYESVPTSHSAHCQPPPAVSTVCNQCAIHKDRAVCANLAPAVSSVFSISVSHCVVLACYVQKHKAVMCGFDSSSVAPSAVLKPKPFPNWLNPLCPTANTNTSTSTNTNTI